MENDEHSMARAIREAASELNRTIQNAANYDIITILSVVGQGNTPTQKINVDRIDKRVRL